MVRYYHDFKYPDASEPVVSGDCANVPEAIGEAIIWFEALDEMLSTAILFLMGRGDAIGRIITAELSFKGKADLLGALFTHERPNSEYFDHLQQLNSACLQIESKRNQVVHSQWSHELEGPGMERSKYTTRGKRGLQRQSETLTSAQVQAIAHHCGYLAHCVDDLMYREFGREYGEP